MLPSRGPVWGCSAALAYASGAIVAVAAVAAVATAAVSDAVSDAAAASAPGLMRLLRSIVVPLVVRRRLRRRWPWL